MEDDGTGRPALGDPARGCVGHGDDRPGKRPLIVAGGVVVWLVRAPPNVLRRAGTAGEGGSAILLLHLLGFFAYAGTFVFGSGLAIVPFLYGGVVLDTAG